jgi:acetate kinase
VADGRLVVAHLGNGSSMAATLGGQSMDATMGFTPLGGLVMSTRPGDLDPGVLLYLLEERGLSPAALRTMLGAQSGLLGVSGLSSDMRDLLAREHDDPRAALAIDLYCFTARKSIGALAAVLGGLETLVFTAGIGEHAAPVRERICAELGFLGIRLDAARNAADAPIISADGGQVTVRVMPTNEELMIARHTAAVLGASQSAAPKEGSHDADDDAGPRGGHYA